MLYFLITRPQFLLLVNLPIGYPIAFCATFASTVRCGFALLVAVALRPASAASTRPHAIESETRQQFNLELALRLADFAKETYAGFPPRTTALRVMCPALEAVNGTYERSPARTSFAAPIYVCQSKGMELRRRSADEWVILNSSKPDVSLVCAQDSADDANRIVSTWCIPAAKVDPPTEVEEGSEAPAPPEPEVVQLEIIGVQRRFQRRGDCARTDGHWMIVEEEGAPHAPAKVGLAGVPTVAGAVAPPREVSIIVAFRGTHTFQNIRDDARIRMAPVRQGARQGGLMVQEDAEQPRWCGCFPQRAAARRALQRVEEEAIPHFDVDRVEAFLQAEAQRTALAGDSTLRSTRMNLEDWAEETASSGRCAWLGTLCALLLRGCLLCCLPFRKSSDAEEDDEEFSVATLHRVRMHVGFADVYQSIREDVMQTLSERLKYCKAKGEIPKVYITGHSLGGAVASLFALNLASLQLPYASGGREMQQSDIELLQLPSAPVVYTFGAPRLGNASLRSIYNGLVPNTFRMVAALDLVPTMPPSIYYRQVGREIWLDEGGGITYVMSWAMRTLLPARNSPQCHAQVIYIKLLNKAFHQLYSMNYPSAWTGEDDMLGVLDGSVRTEA